MYNLRLFLLLANNITELPTSPETIPTPRHLSLTASCFCVTCFSTFKVCMTVTTFFKVVSSCDTHLLIVWNVFFRMAGNVSPDEVSIDKLKDEIHALLCTFKGSVPSDQLLSNIFTHLCQLWLIR